MHQSFVTTSPHPWGRAGDSIDGQMCCILLLHYPRRVGQMQDCVVGKNGNPMSQTVGGKTALLAVSSSVGLIAEPCWTKSQSPRFSPRMGLPWLQMTGASA